MKCGSRIAVGVLGGYALGRSHKTRMAVLMALLAAGGGKLPVDPADLLRRTPLGAEGGPLDKLTGDLRGQLLDAGKSVAMAAASSRIDSLSDKLQERADTMRAPTGRKPKAPPAQEESRPARKRRREDEFEDEYEDDFEDEYEAEDEAEDRGKGRRGGRGTYEDDEYEDEYEDEAGFEDEYEPEEPEEEREQRRRPARPPRREPRRVAPRSGETASRAPRRTSRATR